MKRLFDCGHRGCGQFCHRCANEQKAAQASQAGAAAKLHPRTDPVESERLRELKSAAASAPIDLSAARSLPSVLERALDLLAKLDAGTHPLALGGQKLTSRGGDFSVQVGLRHRILIDAQSLKPSRFLSHEAYNGEV